MRTIRSFRAALAVLILLTAACGSDDAVDSAAGDRPTVVVTSSILGDVVTNLVGDQAEIVTIMPAGADPHTFQPSAQQVALITDAEALIVNGAGFEEGLLDVIESAEQDEVPMLTAVEFVSTLDFDEDHDHEHDEDHDHDHQHEHDEDHDHDHQDHDHSAVDPHFFSDPARMALAAEAIVDFLASMEGIDEAELREHATGYLDDLESLDAEVETMLDAIPAERRVLVTSHEVFGYFADRYGFEVVATVVPGNTSVDNASAQQLAELAELIENEAVPAIFADTSSSNELAQTLADEVGDVSVVELFSESLGASDSEGASYLAMMRSNGERIADALAG